MFKKISRFLWGDISKSEFKKLIILSMAFLFLMVSYWMMRPIKDGLFLTLVGKFFLPYAKMVSLCVLVFLLMLYAKLVDWFEKNRLFYIVVSTLSICFLIMATILAKNPEIYVQSSILSKAVGWTIYVLIDCSRVIIFSLFWSFVNSCIDTNSAKKGYPLIIMFAKIGAIAGPIMASNATSIGIDVLLFIAGVLIFMVALIIKFFTIMHPQPSDTDVVKATGALEGLRLFKKHPYLLGIAVVSMLPDLVAELLRFSLLFLAESELRSPELIVSFLGRCDLLVSLVVLSFAVFGSSLFLRRCSIRVWLLLYPIILAIGIIYAWTFYSLSSLLIALAIFRSLSHTIDQPCREILLIPTGRDIKFKAGSWISAFGTRSAQSMSAGFVACFSVMGNIESASLIFSLMLIGMYLPVALYVGTTNNRLIQENAILK